MCWLLLEASARLEVSTRSVGVLPPALRKLCLSETSNTPFLIFCFTLFFVPDHFTECLLVDLLFPEALLFEDFLYIFAETFVEGSAPDTLVLLCNLQVYFFEEIPSLDFFFPKLKALVLGFRLLELFSQLIFLPIDLLM